MPEPDDGTSRAAFQIAYDGPRDGGTLYGRPTPRAPRCCRSVISAERPTAVIYGPDAPDVNVRVRANFEEGCFDISFDFVQALKDVGTLVRDR